MTPGFLSEQHLAAHALDAAAGYRQPLYVTGSGYQTTTATAGLVAGTHLTLPVEPNLTCAIEALLVVDTARAGGARIRWELPDRATLTWVSSSEPAVTGGNGTTATAPVTRFTGATPPPQNSGVALARVSGILVTGSTGGPVTLTWAGGPSTAKGTILRPGSWLRVGRLTDGTSLTTTVAVSPPRVVTGSTTLRLTDAGNLVVVDASSPAMVTIPPASTVPWAVGSVVEVVQRGTAAITVRPGAGVTLRTASSTRLRTRWSACALRHAALDEWILAGDLA